ncbi:MAG: Mov34/MPN/PAD-1 family protein [Candidatus Methanomethylophilaceae archaeon]|nr:Mov34/MPN/PAD-1 family protein [Candidatus Methanomethylophilaceae archaeon]
MTRIIDCTDMTTEERKRSVKGVPFFIRDDTVDVMTDHADSGLLDDSEIMGLMIGRVYRDGEGEYVMVDRTISSVLDADEVSVRFDKNDMSQLIDSLDEMKDGERVVGWYHSHLGCGCFLSDTDLDTHSGIFGDGIGFAVVIDPVLRQLKVFGRTDEGLMPVQMIVME